MQILMVGHTGDFMQLSRQWKLLIDVWVAVESVHKKGGTI